MRHSLRLSLRLLVLVSVFGSLLPAAPPAAAQPAPAAAPARHGPLRHASAASVPQLVPSRLELLPAAALAAPPASPPSDPPQGELLSGGQTPTASCANSAIERLTDRNLHNYWSCDEEGTPQFITLALDDVYTVTYVALEGMSYFNEIQYQIDASTDGTTFVTVATGSRDLRGSGSSDYTISETLAIQARAVRVYILGGYYYENYPLRVGASEFLVYGEVRNPTDQNTPPRCPCVDSDGRDAGEPFNVRSGQLWFAATDLANRLPGPDLTWDRTYVTRNTATITGPLGVGWSHAFATRIITPTMPGGEPGMVIVATDAGNRLRFRALGATTFAALPGVYGTLLADSSIFTHTLRDQTQQIFDARNGRLMAIIAPDGRQLALSYTTTSTPAQLVRVADVDDPQRYLAISYTAGGRVETVGDGTRMIGYTYDGAGDLVAVADVLNRVTTYTYTNHLLTAVANPLGELIEQTVYDAATPARRVISQTVLDGRTYQVAYLDATSVVTTTGRDGQQDVEVFRFTPGGTIWSEERNGTVVEQTAFDTTLSPGFRTDANGNTSSTLYTANGLPTQQTDALGTTTRTLYDSQNRPISTTDALGVTALTAYDADGHVVSQTVGIAPGTAIGLTTQYTYTNALLVAQQTPDGVVTAFAHNSRRQVISTTVGVGTALAQTTAFGYDALGHVMTTTVGLGTPLARTDVTVYNLDDTVARTIQHYNDGVYDSAVPDTDIVTRSGYDALGRRIWTQDTLGQYPDLTHYTARGQVDWTLRNPRTPSGQPALPASLPPFDPAQPDANVATLFAYDGLGRTVLVTDTGILTGTFDPQTRTFSAATTRTTRTAYDDQSRPSPLR